MGENQGSLVAVSSLVTAVLTVLFVKGVPAVIALLKTRDTIDRRKSKAETSAEDRRRKETREGIQEYVELLVRDRDQDRQQIAALRAEMNELRAAHAVEVEAERERTEQCERDRAKSELFRAQAETWIRATRDALRRQNIDIPEYLPDIGLSAIYTALDAGTPLPSPPSPPAIGEREK